MKTPEDIKKALECCSDADGFDGDCIKCPYKGEQWCGDKSKIDALAYIQQLEATQPKWISVEERLPDDNGYFLTKIHCDKRDWIEVNTFDHTEKEWWHDTGNRTEEATEFVTHWIPIPEPPKEV